MRGAEALLIIRKIYGISLTAAGADDNDPRIRKISKIRIKNIPADRDQRG